MQCKSGPRWGLHVEGLRASEEDQPIGNLFFRASDLLTKGNWQFYI
jgi:hypothetical protein